MEWLETRFEVAFDREPAKRAFEEQDGVHRKLLALPFHRFITSNYDVVLDGFLAQERLGLPLKGEKFKSFLEEKAFTQADRNTEKMAARIMVLPTGQCVSKVNIGVICEVIRSALKDGRNIRSLLRQNRVVAHVGLAPASKG